MIAEVIALFNELINILKQLDARVNPSVIDGLHCEGNTLVHLAVGLNDQEALQLLLTVGADLRPINKNGKSALHLAYELKDSYTTALRTSRERKDKYKQVIAILKNDLLSLDQFREVVNTLYDQSIKEKNDLVRNEIVQISQQPPSHQIAARLLQIAREQRDHQYSRIHRYEEQEKTSFQIMSLLSREQVNRHYVGHSKLDQEPPIFTRRGTAAYSTKCEALLARLEIDLFEGNAWQTMDELVVCFNQSKGCIKEQLVQATYNDQDTLLHIAVTLVHIPAIKMLIAAGAAPEARNSHGVTPLMIAKNNRHIPVQIIELLKNNAHFYEQFVTIKKKLETAWRIYLASVAHTTTSSSSSSDACAAAGASAATEANETGEDSISSEDNGAAEASTATEANVATEANTDPGASSATTEAGVAAEANATARSNYNSSITLFPPPQKSVLEGDLTTLSLKV